MKGVVPIFSRRVLICIKNIDNALRLFTGQGVLWDIDGLFRGFCDTVADSSGASADESGDEQDANPKPAVTTRTLTNPVLKRRVPNDNASSCGSVM